METIQIRLGGKPTVNPQDLRAELMRYNAANPASAIPISTFDGKANSFRWTTGPTPGSGWVLMLWDDLQHLVLSDPQPLEFIQSDTIIVMPAIVIVHATKVCGHTDDPKAVYVVELTDRRYHARRSAFDQQFNVEAPEKFFYWATMQPAVGAGLPVAHSWDTLVEALWLQMPPLGDYPGVDGFALPGGSPYDMRWPGENPYEALATVLDKCGAILNYNPIEDLFSIIQHGNAVDLIELNQLLGQYQHFIADSQPQENLAAKLPSTLKVCFTNRNWFYGLDPTIPTSQDAWQTRPAFTIDIATGEGEPGTSEVIWDDLPAEYDIEGNIENAGQLSARAGERLSAYLKSKLVGEARFKRTYSGLCNGDFVTSGSLSGVCYHQLGDGLKTTILRTTRQAINAATNGDWNNPSIITIEQESLAAPDVARAHTPFQRFAWVEIVTSVSPGKCGTAKVLRARKDGNCLKWIPCQTRFGDLIVDVNDPTGATSYQPGQRVLAWYHWQSNWWTLISGGGSGSGGGFWAELVARAGIAYTWKKVDPVGGCTFVPDPTLTGVFNAFDVNCSSHNSQGPINNLRVWMRGPYFTADFEVFWLFDYSGTNERDEERFPFTP